MSRTVAFIGLGHMGGPMAANLVKAGHRVRGYDLSPAFLKAAADAGVEPAASATQAVTGAEVVITMLPAGRHVLELYEDIVGAARPGTLFADCSTIDVADARTAHDRAVSAGMRALDAPVSGGVVGAEAATLTFMAGGGEDEYAEAEPLLAAMGRKVVHCGGAGAGQAAKICNNMILGVSVIAVSRRSYSARAWACPTRRCTTWPPRRPASAGHSASTARCRGPCRPAPRTVTTVPASPPRSWPRTWAWRPTRPEPVA